MKSVKETVPKKCKLFLFIFLFLFSIQLGAGWAEAGFQNWEPSVGGDLEFGITSLVSAVEEDAPWVFEGGYNGANWFDKDNTLGQTFTVSSDRLLQSVTTRVNAWNNAVGQFEMAIYEFDQSSKSTTNRLAFVTGDADSYRYDLLSVPMSTFDMSSFNVTLTAGQPYMLTFRGMESSVGTFSVQSASNIYGGGIIYHGTYTEIAPDLTGSWYEPIKEKCKEKKEGLVCKIKAKLLFGNAGEVDAEYVVVRFYLSDDDSYDEGDTLLNEKIKKTIKAGKAYKKSFKAVLPVGMSLEGRYIIAYIDADNTISESDESNNFVVY